MTAPAPVVETAPAVADPVIAPPVVTAPPAKPSLEDSLASLDEATRAYVLGEVKKGRTEAQSLRARLTEAEPQLAEYTKLLDAQKTAEQRATEAATAANTRATALLDRAINSEVKALAADLFADPSDAAAFLKLDKYASADGDIDTAAITADLADLLTRKPHLGKPSGTPNRTPAPNPAQGSGGEGGPAIDDEIAAASKAGDWRKAMQLTNQKLAAIPRP